MISIVYFFNGKKGGISSVIRNMLTYADLLRFDNHVIITVESRNTSEPEFWDFPNVKSQVTFYYTRCSNFYRISKRLADLIPNEQSILITQDWLELGMISCLGLRNPVVQILHGNYDYYYNLAKLHQRNVDLYFCVSKAITERLESELIDKTIIDWRFPIPSNVLNLVEENGFITIAYFVGNLADSNKNYFLLPDIDRLLLSLDVSVNWKLAGDGMSNEDVFSIWPQDSRPRVEFVGYLSGDDICFFLRNCDLMVLPSKFEGLPVSVIEAMKQGVIPIIPFWGGALENIVIHGDTGFYVSDCKAEDFASIISMFQRNPHLRRVMPIKAKQRVDLIFDPEISIGLFEAEIIQLRSTDKPCFKAYGSRLDSKLIPDFVVRFVRAFKLLLSW
jgi:glycosyltransferase involved in cell wall biosynthesis